MVKFTCNHQDRFYTVLKIRK